MDTRKTTELRAAGGIKSSTIFDSVSLNADGKVTIALSKEEFTEFFAEAFNAEGQANQMCTLYMFPIDHKVNYEAAAGSSAGGTTLPSDDCVTVYMNCWRIGPVIDDMREWVKAGIIVREKFNAEQLAAIDAIRSDVNRSIGRQ